MLYYRIAYEARFPFHNDTKRRKKPWQKSDATSVAGYCERVKARGRTCNMFTRCWNRLNVLLNVLLFRAKLHKVLPGFAKF